MKRLAQCSQPLAHAPDGLFGAIELPEHPFCLAVQWHPEWLQEQEPMRALFKELVEAIKRERLHD